ncbi:protein EARLY STARVATION 1, chloroplastic-like isoform X1 [Tasmannia lanceolata]|uniref:protein EARLY STARVATION 1, chloroplastic-like isoform X1 n=1 Tax=Tasmannia lanceolata TaxID=3420 RepID=UPI004064A6D4
MEASSKSLSAPFHLKLQNSSAFPLRPGIAFRRRRKWSRGGDGNGWNGISCCCSDTEFRNLIQTDPFKRGEESRSSSSHVRAMPPQSFASPRPRNVSKQVEFYPRCSPRYSAPQSRDTPPKRDTGIASEKDWGINWLNEMVNESGANEDGSTWHRESGEDLGDNGYRCRWARMGGQCHDGSSEWKETWWEKSDWTGYKELGVEKSGKNAEGDSWWETWKEVFHQDEWSNLTRIERSAQKQAKGGSESAGWYEEWWEKYDARGWTEKGAHKYGRLNEQSWWEQWGEHYDGRGSVLKWTDKWAETKIGSKWGDKWEEKFFAGIGSRHGETWHASSTGDRWSRTWGEEHSGNGKVHKYGRSTTGESWDIVVDEETYYEAEPHYGWADVVGNSSQLLSIQPRERLPGVYPNLDFGSSPPAPDDLPESELDSPPPPSAQ